MGGGIRSRSATPQVSQISTGAEEYRQITGSSACFKNEQANFDKLRYAEPPDCFATQNSVGSDHSGLGKLKTDHTGLFLIWLGRRDSNPRMSAPKADALPLGDAPIN